MMVHYCIGKEKIGNKAKSLAEKKYINMESVQIQEKKLGFPLISKSKPLLSLSLFLSCDRLSPSLGIGPVMDRGRL